MTQPAVITVDSSLRHPTKITDTQSWQDLPTCKESGLDVSYTMLRGIFMPPGVTDDQKKFYVERLKKVRATAEWKDYMEKGAFNQTYMDGDAYFQWLGKAEQTHRELMKGAGFLAQ